jgi:hypothetical protein
MLYATGWRIKILLWYWSSWWSVISTYVNKCLSKLGKTSYKITETPLYIENFRARLPDNFYGVKEAWMCSEFLYGLMKSLDLFLFTSFHLLLYSFSCSNPICSRIPCCANVGCVDHVCLSLQTVYKTTNSIPRAYRRQFLLKPTIVANEQIWLHRKFRIVWSRCVS